jgi:hypothetical protein
MAHPHVLTFELQQHTPLIHFQPEQEGAGLRATEVKPKLDKFLLTHLGNGSYEAGFRVAKASGFLLNADLNNALAYQMQIIQNSDNLVFSVENDYTDHKGNKRTEKFPTFFGLMGVNEADKQFAYCPSQTLLIKKCHPALAEVVKSQLGNFFFQHTFGTRQSKGFGSYTVRDTTLSNRPTSYFNFEVDTNRVRVQYKAKPAEETQHVFMTQLKLFYTINLFYNTLRSGLNQYDKGNDSFYFKSLLFKYTKETFGAVWDKRAIKEKFFPRDFSQQQSNHPRADELHFNGTSRLLMRDLLGLASDAQWKSYYASIKKESPVIDRFKSPITFKPVHMGNGVFRVYLIEDQQSLEGMLGKTFKITAAPNKQEMALQTPEKFDLHSYLRYAFGHDVAAHIRFKNGVSRSADSDLLVHIYSQLRTQI